MEKIVVDSSVVVKWFVEEEKSQKARALLSKHEDELVTLYAPDNIILEVLNGLFFQATLNLVTKEKITFYDGLFVALAQMLDCTLVTNDKKHHLKKYYSKIKY